MISRAFSFPKPGRVGRRQACSQKTWTDPRVSTAAGLPDQIRCPHRRTSQPRWEKLALPAPALTVQKSFALQLLCCLGFRKDTGDVLLKGPRTPRIRCSAAQEEARSQPEMWSLTFPHPCPGHSPLPCPRSAHRNKVSVRMGVWGRGTCISKGRQPGGHWP